MGVVPYDMSAVPRASEPDCDRTEVVSCNISASSNSV